MIMRNDAVMVMSIVATLMLSCPGSGAPATTAPSSAVVKFADGSVVEIVAVSDEGQKVPQAWAPDGTELPAVPWAKSDSGARGMQPPIREGMRTLRFLCRATLVDEKSNPRLLVTPVLAPRKLPRDPGGGAATGQQRMAG